MTAQFYLSQAAGFFLQLFPCVILCFLPFDSDSMRWKQRNCLLADMMLALIATLLFPVALKLSVVTKFGHRSDFGSLYMILVIALILFLFSLQLKETFIKKMLTVNMVSFYAATVYMLMNMVTPLVQLGKEELVYDPLQLLVCAGSTAVLFPVMFWLLRGVMKSYLREIEIENIRNASTAILLVGLLYFASMFVYSIVLEFNNAAWWILCPPFIVMSVVLIAFYWLLFRESVRRKRENEYMRYAKIQDMQYQKIRNDIEKAARLRHDVRHHDRVLYELLGAGNVEEAYSYLASLMNQASMMESRQFCLNPTINGLLQYYVSWAKDEKIECRISADCQETTISPLDLTTILGNVMENAIYACKKRKEDRWIRVNIGMAGTSVLILVENACEGVVLEKGYDANQKFYPAEAFKSIHTTGGYGLRNIVLSVRHYDGEVQFCYDEQNKRFMTRIRMNEPEDGEAIPQSGTELKRDRVNDY